MRHLLGKALAAEASSETLWQRQGQHFRRVQIAMMLKAPFPYHGGKRRVADLVWLKFALIERYLEMFGGSLAVMLANPNPPPMEICCDTNSYVTNFWRSAVHDFEQLAYYCTYPTIHDDLIARQKTLMQWMQENKHRCIEDDSYYDARIAGYWCWGVSNSISMSRYPDRKTAIPISSSTGQGIMLKRPKLQRPDLDTSIPHVKSNNSAIGVSLQKASLDKSIPHVNRQNNVANGIALQKSSLSKTPDVIRSLSAYPAIHDWILALAQRLERVSILNRPWKSLTSPSILGNTPTTSCDVAIFCDPPYLTSDRHVSYKDEEQSDQAATESYEWCVSHGEDYKISYCCHEGDFPVPPGWTSETRTFTGIRNDERRGKRDLIMFSPRCTPEFSDLFGATT